jgi:hypothetical protein
MVVVKNVEDREIHNACSHTSDPAIWGKSLHGNRSNNPRNGSAIKIKAITPKTGSAENLNLNTT